MYMVIYFNVILNYLAPINQFIVRLRKFFLCKCSEIETKNFSSLAVNSGLIILAYLKRLANDNSTLFSHQTLPCQEAVY